VDSSEPDEDGILRHGKGQFQLRKAAFLHQTTLQKQVGKFGDFGAAFGYRKASSQKKKRKAKKLDEFELTRSSTKKKRKIDPELMELIGKQLV